MDRTRHATESNKKQSQHLLKKKEIYKAGEDLASQAKNRPDEIHVDNGAMAQPELQDAADTESQ